MGNMHFKCYKTHNDANLVAVCDEDRTKFTDSAGTAGNIAGTEEPLDFTGIELYTDFNKMLKDARLDALSITLPTYMHLDHTLKALNAGINVLCEKPMALTIEEGRKMIETAEKTGRLLQIGHCIRFWPEYVKTKELIDSKDYGKVIAASFRRLSLTPTWSWQNWLMNGNVSGGALMDLHIHDSDFVQYVFGMPAAVFSRGAKGPSGDFDHVITQYIYDDQKIVCAEGGFVMTPSFGFEMSFNVIMEKATIVYDCTRQPAFKVCPEKGDAFTPEIAPGDGYSREIDHFIKAAGGQNVPAVTTPAQSLDSVRLILAEKKSIETKKPVTIK